jgi:hypothetical protein
MTDPTKTRRRKTKMKKMTFISTLALIGLVVGLMPPTNWIRVAASSSQGAARQKAASALMSRQVVVHAAGHGTPWVNLSDGRDGLTTYTGAAALRQIVEENLARPHALATGDFDEDGVADLVSGYAGPAGGILTLHRGNLYSIYPNYQGSGVRDQGSEVAPFLSPGHVFELADAPDFLGTGDFDADGHMDVAAATQGSEALYLLAGNGQGGFHSAEKIDLPGAVTALATGEVNRADGLADVVVGIGGSDDSRVLIFEGPQGALRSQPEIIPLPDDVTALALGQLDEDYPIDLAMAANHQVLIMHGQDRRLSVHEHSQGKPVVTTIEDLSPLAVLSLAVGDFIGDSRSELAVLSEVGTVHFFARGTRSETTKEEPAEMNIWQVSHEMPVLESPRLPAPQPVLIPARLSSGPYDDLVIIDDAHRQLNIISNLKLNQSAIRHPPSAIRMSAILDIEGEPVAVLPMRLNADALSDLVVLREGQTNPSIIVTAAMATFTVTNTTDKGPGSFRQAILEANANPGMDRIVFNIPGTGPHTINVLREGLPIITDAVTIDATTQPGYAGKPVIELNGASVTAGATGLTITAGNTTVRGLAINRFVFDPSPPAGFNVGNGITLALNGGNLIEGNFIGTNVAGTLAQGNDLDGIWVYQSGYNTIGGTTSTARNVIAGNRGSGIGLVGSSSNGNVVQGNLVGTDVTGSVALGNLYGGVGIFGASNNRIGGTTPAAANVISGNNDIGLSIYGPGSGNLVQGNLIGTNKSGTSTLSNLYDGVILSYGALDNTIGGPTASARNVISGNRRYGVYITGFVNGAAGNLVQNNLIGTRADGLGRLGNRGHGLRIDLDADDNAVGGISGTGNTIAYNGGNGVFVESGTGNAILTNSIFANVGIGIDLGGDGMTPNDPEDADMGPNEMQNYPVLSSAAASSNLIRGSLHSKPASRFTVEFFTNTSCNSAGNGDGERFIGSMTVTTDGSGNVQFSFTPQTRVSAGQFITARTTDASNNTSEFSACFMVTSN